jgi:hypothetical protein
MLEQLVGYAAPVSEPAPGVSADVVAGLAVALIVIVVVVRYLKVILLLVAFAFLAVLFVGILQIEPYIAQFIENLRAAGGS